jgi:release factor glutamine methyltransferase
MTTADWLFEAMRKLGNAGVDSPRRDAFVFIEDVLKKDRAWVNAHGEHELNNQQIKALDALIERRMKREPLAYVRGKGWFYGRFFDVTPDVMIPRPESESFINLLKQIIEDGPTIIDVGTGSGCLAITAKLELPKAEIIAIDLSQKALKIAKQNAKNHHADIQFHHGSLLEPLLSSTFHLPPSILMTNLPYVPEGLITSPEITHEPSNALFSGKDGLDHYRALWQQITELKNKPHYILTESLESQHKALIKLAQKSGYKLVKTEVLVQLFSKIA